MANRQKQNVTYQPFRVNPLLSDGLLPVAREGGDLERRVAQGLFHMAGYFGEQADAQANREGFLAGQKAALEGRTTSSIDYQHGVDPALTESIPNERGGVADKLRKAAARYGQDGETLVAIGQIESGLNPGARNPNSTAGGLLQFIDSTAKNYGLANRFDVDQAADAGARLLKDNRTYLARTLGREPTAGELYLAHQQGAGGAAKLLANPNRRASDIVGYDAVRLNGGNAGMTAAEFARKWTGKVKPLGAAKIIADRPVFSPSETSLPADTGSGVTLSGGTFRPTGRDTVYGRAYDKAGVASYLTMLDAEVASTTSQMWRKYQDDPAKLAEGFDTLRQEFLKSHVFPEIGADFEAAFVRKTGAWLDNAYERQAQKAKEADQADYMARAQSMEDVQAQRIAGLDAANPNVADEIARGQAGIAAHYDEAVSKGLMSAPAAEAAKQKSQHDTAIGFYSRQAEDLNAADVEAMRGALSADYAEGGVPGLDAESYDAVVNKLDALARTKKSAEQQAQTALRQRGDDLAKRLLMGFDVAPADMAQLTLDSGTTAGGAAELKLTQDRIAIARAMRDLPLPEAAKRLEDMRKAIGPNATNEQIETFAFGAGLLESKRKALSTDLVSFAESQGVAPVTGDIAAADPADIPGILSARVAAAERAADHYGVPPRFLKAGEAKAVATLIRENPQTGATVAAAIVAGAGQRAHEVLAEFGADAPLIAGAGLILANGGSAQAAEDAIIGANDKSIKVKRKPALYRQEFDGVTGSALDYQPEDGKRIMSIGAAIARKRIDESGVDPDSEEAAAIHEQAVNEAAGAVYDKGVKYGGFADYGGGFFGGAQKVLVPSSIRADRFSEVIGAFTDADLALKPQGGVAALADMIPVAVDGGYVFADGDGAFVGDEFGQVFKLDVEAFRKIIGPRVPVAFR